MRTDLKKIKLTTLKERIYNNIAIYNLMNNIETYNKDLILRKKGAGYLGEKIIEQNLKSNLLEQYNEVHPIYLLN